MNYLPRDPPPKLRGLARDRFLLSEQRKWIESCENNGVSYSGPNGPAIRKADADALAILEARVGE